jgi:hypothetical protein
VIWLAGVLGVVILVLVACLFGRRNPEPPLDPEATMQAAVELHRIRRDLDVAYLKSEQRRDASLVEHRIIEIIDGGDGS